ncbi:MAG TPA: LPD38 domain-containing protein, partial [Candidatus Dormibacteraeota bacterium]|nr:LPD38 domain-containing protein [Candidatus Dormibacteraeota bacterium]
MAGDDKRTRLKNTLGMIEGGKLSKDDRARAFGYARKLHDEIKAEAATPSYLGKIRGEMMQDISYAASKFNEGLGGLLTAAGDLPKNIVGAVADDSTAQILAPFTQPFSEVGHALGDPLRQSPHFQQPAEQAAAFEQRTGLPGKVLFGDVPRMAPLLLTGQAAVPAMAGQALSESLSPEVRQQAEEQAKAEGRPPPTSWDIAKNAAIQTGLAAAAGAAGPVGRIGKVVEQGAVRTLEEAVLSATATATKDFGLMYGQSALGQAAAQHYLGTEPSPEDQVRSGLAGAVFGQLTGALTPSRPRQEPPVDFDASAQMVPVEVRDVPVTAQDVAPEAQLKVVGKEAEATRDSAYYPRTFDDLKDMAPQDMATAGFKAMERVHGELRAAGLSHEEALNVQNSLLTHLGDDAASVAGRETLSRYMENLPPETQKNVARPRGEDGPSVRELVAADVIHRIFEMPEQKARATALTEFFGDPGPEGWSAKTKDRAFEVVGEKLGFTRKAEEKPVAQAKAEPVQAGTPEVVAPAATPAKKAARGAPASVLSSPRRTRRTDSVPLINPSSSSIPGTGGAPLPNPASGLASIAHVPRAVLTAIMNPRAMPRHDEVVGTHNVKDRLVLALETMGMDPAIRIGRLAHSWAAGQFSPTTHVIRLGMANDIHTMAHEVGHAIETAMFGHLKGNPWDTVAKDMQAELLRLGHIAYPKGGPEPARGYRREGWAEFMRHYITDRATAMKEAPASMRWMEGTFLAQNRETGEQLDHATELWQRWITQTPLQRAEAMMANPSSPVSRALVYRAKLGRFFSYQAHFDQGWAIHEFTKKAMDSLGVKAFPVQKDPSRLLSALRGTADAIAEQHVKKQMTDFYGKPVGPSLQELTIGAKGKMRLLSYYLWANRAKALYEWQDALAKKSGQDPEYKYPGISREDAEAIVSAIDSHEPGVSQAAAGTYRWWEMVNDYVAQASPSYANMIQGTREGDPGYYVPLHAEGNDVAEEWVRSGRRTKGTTPGALIRSLSGHGDRTIDPLSSILAEHSTRIRKAHKEAIQNAIFELASVPGVGSSIEKVQTPISPVAERSLNELIREIEKKVNAGGGSAAIDFGTVDPESLLTFYAPMMMNTNGRPIVPRFTRVANAAGDGYRTQVEWYEVAPELYHAMGAMDHYALDQTKLLPALMMKSKTLFTLGTTARASFGLITNPTRDFGDLWLNTRSHVNAFQLASEWLRSMAAYAVYDATGGTRSISSADREVIHAYERLGLRGSHFFASDIYSAARAKKQLYQTGKVHYLDPRTGWDFVRELLQFPEVASRLTEFRLVGKEMGWKPGDWLTDEQAVNLMIASKQATIDFTRAGEFARAVNQIVPFYNAAFQGPLANVAALRRDPKRFMLKGILSMTLPTLYLWWQNKDKQWYREMDANERHRYWHFEYQFGENQGRIRIPRPQVPGFVFGSVPEALFDAAYTENPTGTQGAIGDVLEYGMNTLAPPILPPVVATASEEMLNKQFYT